MRRLEKTIEIREKTCNEIEKKNDEVIWGVFSVFFPDLSFLSMGSIKIQEQLTLMEEGMVKEEQC